MISVRHGLILRYPSIDKLFNITITFIFDIIVTIKAINSYWFVIVFIF